MPRTLTDLIPNNLHIDGGGIISLTFSFCLGGLDLIQRCANIYQMKMVLCLVAPPSINYIFISHFLLIACNSQQTPNSFSFNKNKSNEKENTIHFPKRIWTNHISLRRIGKSFSESIRKCFVVGWRYEYSRCSASFRQN